MISSLLELNSSPTQQRELKRTAKFITVELEDDSNVKFQIKIDYVTYPYWGLGAEVVVSDFDYEVNGMPNISRQDIISWIKDCIREEEKVTVTFE